MKKILKYIKENCVFIIFIITWCLVQFYTVNTYFILKNHLKKDEEFNCTLLKNIEEIEVDDDFYFPNNEVSATIIDKYGNSHTGIDTYYGYDII